MTPPHQQRATCSTHILSWCHFLFLIISLRGPYPVHKPLCLTLAQFWLVSVVTYVHKHKTRTQWRTRVDRCVYIYTHIRTLLVNIKEKINGIEKALIRRITLRVEAEDVDVWAKINQTVFDFNYSTERAREREKMPKSRRVVAGYMN